MNLADALNLQCLCNTLQTEYLDPALVQSHPNLFSATPVFVAPQDYRAIERSIAALNRVANLPGHVASVLDRSTRIAAHDFGPTGAFMGYDFHMSERGPRLIEINTNAGGALLHVAATRAHRPCCDSMDRMFDTPSKLDNMDDVFLDMFRSEWRAQRGDAPLRMIAIVDDEPDMQYLAPEFEFAQRLFESHGIGAVIADASQLQWRDGLLWHEGKSIDMVYNRLTDFDLSEARHAALRDAYVAGAAVVTPHPRAHALHADKRNLIAFSDDALLETWGATPEDRALLQAVVPRTQLVTAGNADELWARRRELFFKPATGYGSKAAYRGEKLTRRVWDEIVQGNFVAQELVRPSERAVRVDGVATKLKLDIRAYAHAGRVLLLAARTYSGQTTNFRTAGGGFSPVVVLPISQ